MYDMTTPEPSTTLKLEDLLAKWQEMESDWHIQHSSSAETPTRTPPSHQDNDRRQAVLQQTARLQQLLHQHAVWSARWKWIPPPFYTHWTAGQRARYLDVSSVQQTHGVAMAAPLVRTAVLENTCVVNDIDPTYPRFCVVVWPCTATLSVSKVTVALQGLRKADQRVATKHYSWVWALPKDVDRITGCLTAQCACPLLPSTANHGIPVILSKSVVPLRFFWMDTGHVQAKVGVTVADFVKLVRPTVASIEQTLVDEQRLTDPDVPGTVLDVIPETLRRHDGVDVEALRLEALPQALPRVADDASTDFRPPRRGVPLHVLHKDNQIALEKRQHRQQRLAQQEQERIQRTLSQRKSPVPRQLPPTSRLLQHTQSSAAYFRPKEKENHENQSVVTPPRRKPALPPEARGQSNRPLRGYERPTASRGRSVPPTSDNRTPSRRSRGTSAPSRAKTVTSSKNSRSTERRLQVLPNTAKKDTQAEDYEEADELIGSVENDDDFMNMMTTSDDMLLDDLLTDEGEIVFDDGDSVSPTAGKAGEDDPSPNATKASLSPKKELSTQVVSELYKKLTAIPVPSPEEMQALFEQVDRDGRGMLRLRHIETAIVQRQFDLPPTVVLRAFQTVDADEDGAIGRDEFFQFLRWITYFENVMQLFTEMDVDSDRRLGKEEFLKAADVLEVSDPEAVFGEMNGNRKGHVVFDEFCLWMAEKRSLEHVAKQSKGYKFSTEPTASLPRSPDLDTAAEESAKETTPTTEEQLLREKTEDEQLGVAAERKSESEQLAAAELARLEEERMLVAENYKKAEAAVLIQSNARKQLARKQFVEMVAEKETRRRSVQEADAACKIQSCARRRVALERYNNLLSEKEATEKVRLKKEEEERLAKIEQERKETERVAKLEEEHKGREEAQRLTKLEQECVSNEKVAAEAEAKGIEEEELACGGTDEDRDSESLERETPMAREAETEATAECMNEEQPHAEKTPLMSVPVPSEPETERTLDFGPTMESATGQETESTSDVRDDDVPASVGITSEGVASQVSVESTKVFSHIGNMLTEEDRSLLASEDIEKHDHELIEETPTASATVEGLASKKSGGDLDEGTENPMSPVFETPRKEDKEVDTTVDTELSCFSVDGLSPIKLETDVMVEETTVLSGRETPIVSNASPTKSTADKDAERSAVEDVDRERLKAIMERRRKMEEEGVVSFDKISNGKTTQSTIDLELQQKMQKRRSLSDDGVSGLAGAERRASVRHAGLDEEAQSKMERRRCLSDDGAVLTEEVERRANTRRKELKSFQMSNDLQAIMARRRKAADGE